MSTEALALLDSSLAASQQAGAKKRNRTDETGAVADFAAILAQLQGGAIGFQRAELNLTVPQQADPSATTTPAAEPLDRDRGRDRQALDGDDKGRDADEPAEARGDNSRRSDDAARRSNDAAQRPAAAMTIAAATDASTAPQPATQTQAAATQAQAQPQAVDPNKAQATGKAQAEIAATAQTPDTATANGAASDAARQSAAASLPGGVKVKAEIVQDNAAPTTGATLNAATALAAQSQRSGPADATNAPDAAILGEGGDGTANPTAQLTPFASRSGQGQNQGQSQTGQGNAQHGQAQQQTAAQATGQQAMPAAAMPGAVVQPAQAGFQAALNAAGNGNQGGPNGQQPVQTIGGESLTSTAAVTGQASNATGRAGSAAQPSSARLHQPTTPADQVAVQIQRAAGQGSDKISIQLSPEELGRIDVKLEMKDGKMHALISADRPETLDMLKQDARGLVQSLQNAGLQTDAGSLSFNLRGGDAQAQNQNQGSNNGQHGWQGGNAQDQADQRPAHPLFSSPQDLARAGADGRLDVRV